MQKMEIISASGNVSSTVIGSRYNIAQPGVTIRVGVPKGDVVGSQKVNNDLLLVMKNGEKITLENFFSTDGDIKNKLVLDDGESLYLADYNAQSFAGLTFTPVASMDAVTAAEEGGISTAAWLVPLIGVAAVGAGIAIHNSRGGGDGGGQSSSNGSSNSSSDGNSSDSNSNDSNSVSVEALASLDSANGAVQDAEALMNTAVQLKATAVEKLSAALALKAEVLESNDLTRVDEVNELIAQANAALEAAVTAAEEANAAVAAAEESIAQISSEIDASLIPECCGPIDTSDLESIDSGLQVDTPSTFFEAIGTFVQSCIDSVKAVYQQISDSKPGEIIQTVIDGIFTGIDAVIDVIGTKIGAVVDSVKTAFGTVGELIGTEVSFFSELFSIASQTVKDAVSGVFSTITDSISAVISGITDGVSDALQGMTLLDWINPLNWVGVAKDAIVNSAGNIFSSIVDIITSIPGKIIDTITDTVSQVTDALVTKWGDSFTAVKDSISDVLTTLCDAFIKNPFDTLISPIIEKITDFISDPIGSISSLISTLAEVVTDSVDIVKSLISLPGELIENAGTLISDIFNSIFGSDSVIEGNGSEIQDLLAELSDGSGDISLDAVISASTEETTTVAETTVDNVTELTTTALQTDDSLSTALAVAA